jgi:hypothetical protein
MFAPFQHSTESSATRRAPSSYGSWQESGGLSTGNFAAEVSLNGSPERERKRMGARRSKGKKEGRASKMLDTTRGGLSRPSDNAWARVAVERTPAISGLIGFCSNFLDVMETSCLQHTRGALR